MYSKHNTFLSVCLVRVMREVGANLGIPVHVFGPETHMTAVVGMALGKRPIPSESVVEFSTANFLLPGGQEDEVCS
jgi:ATP citrate (pro-S)-lyase